MNDQEIEDGVFVPRGLLGAARYAIMHKANAPNTYANLGKYVYPNGNSADKDVLLAADEEARQIEIDRDTKAANLQLLVEKVLGVEAIVGDGDEYQCAISAAIDFARGLKQ